jgi:hypothetical protein
MTSTRRATSTDPEGRLTAPISALSTPFLAMAVLRILATAKAIADLSASPARDMVRCRLRQGPQGERAELTLLRAAPHPRAGNRGLLVAERPPLSPSLCPRRGGNLGARRRVFHRQELAQEHHGRPLPHCCLNGVNDRRSSPKAYARSQSPQTITERRSVAGDFLGSIPSLGGRREIVAGIDDRTR